jgi:hypothetical protein
MYKYWTAQQACAAAGANQVEDRNNDPWEQTLRELTGLTMNEELISTVASQAQRSGLLYPMYGRVGHAAARYGNLSFRVSPLLIDLCRTVISKTLCGEKRRTRFDRYQPNGAAGRCTPTTSKKYRRPCLADFVVVPTFGGRLQQTQVLRCPQMLESVKFG